MIMNNPISPSISNGYFSDLSKNNSKEDLKRIIDRRDSLHGIGTNSKKFPTKALVINLAERQDRWEIFREKNPDIFEIMDVQRFDAIQKNDVREAIFLSHLGCLENLQEDDTILVLEDDCELALGWYEKLKKAFSDLPSSWDVLIGNHYFFGEMNVLSENLAKPSGRASTANFVLYSGTAIKKIQNEFNLREGGLEDVDHFLTDPRTSILNFTVWPMISREFVSFSDHHKKVRNMEFRVREHAFLFPYVDSHVYYPSIECW